jgi:hypothetical protein
MHINRKNAAPRLIISLTLNIFDSQRIHSVVGRSNNRKALRRMSHSHSAQYAVAIAPYDHRQGCADAANEQRQVCGRDMSLL